jgi:colicin import membrane protein
MSAAVYYEPNKLPAGILALVVHSVFFALLYFGFNWNRQVSSPATMSVELWPSLPEEVVAPPVNFKVEEVVQPPPQEKIVEPDIVMPEKKKVATKPVATKPEKNKPVLKPVEVVKPKPKPDTQKPAEQNPDARIADRQAAREQAMMAEQAAREQAEKAAREASDRAEQAAAKGKMVDEYMAKIQAKIRRNVVMPPDVAKDANGLFSVTLLPGGAVLKAELKKSSGNAAYDTAVERAILKSDPLPLPPDAQLFNRFRELNLPFHPGE